MHAALATLQSEITVALAGLDSTETQATPAGHPEKWSIQQIATHLLLSYASTAKVLQVRLDKGTPTLAKPSLQQRIGQFALIACGLFPRGRSAPEPVTPPATSEPVSGAELTRQFQQALTGLDALLTQGEILFGDRRAASHLVLGPLSMQQWAKFHLVHARHHIKQIQAIRQDSRS